MKKKTSVKEFALGVLAIALATVGLVSLASHFDHSISRNAIAGCPSGTEGQCQNVHRV